MFFFTADEAGVPPAEEGGTAAAAADPPAGVVHTCYPACIMLFRPATGGARAGWAPDAANRAAGGACDRAAQGGRAGATAAQGDPHQRPLPPG